VIESQKQTAAAGDTDVQKRAKFGVGIGVIVFSMGFLAWLGYGESKTYYHTIAELQTLQGAALSHRMRVGGTVEPGSIRRLTGRVDFVLQGEGKTLPVSYVGRDPLPDTFIDKSQALVEGRPAPDGRFVAENVQAKCASKYEAAPGGTGAPVSSTQRSGM
jgi:cytochrome c-type biogenesis protein CcmE